MFDGGNNLQVTIHICHIVSHDHHRSKSTRPFMEIFEQEAFRFEKQFQFFISDSAVHGIFHSDLLLEYMNSSFMLRGVYLC